jgi:arginase
MTAMTHDGTTTEAAATRRGDPRKPLRLFFPQWQGSGDTLALHRGALLLRERFFADGACLEVPVPTGGERRLEAGIHGRSALLEQLRTARELLAKAAPKRIFTIGGDCAVELAPLAYLNARCGGDLAVLWFDAHGDLNTPQSSPSAAFHGMPLRCLLGEGDPAFTALCTPWLEPYQVALVGTRDLDPPEEAYVHAAGIRVIPPAPSGACLESIGRFLEGTKASSVYIHLDLDAMDPARFPHCLCPTPGGFAPEELLAILGAIFRERRVAGFSLVEVAPQEPRAAECLAPFGALGDSLRSL